MPKFSLELYRSRSADIAAKRLAAQEAYEAAALANALDDSAGGQIEARAAVADLDAQQEALDAALAKFNRDGRMLAAQEARAAWQVDADEVTAIAETALKDARAILEPIIPTLRAAREAYAKARADLRGVVRRHRLVSDWRGSWNPVWELNRLADPQVNAADAVASLIQAFVDLSRISADAIERVAPEEFLEEAA